MNSPRHYVRFFSGGIEDWGADAQRVIKCFDPAATEHSVYEVSVEEELLVAAAHRCSTPRKKSDAVSILRILPTSLAGFGIRVGEFQFGETGFPLWDSRHRNLIAKHAEIARMADYICRRHAQGYENVRRILKPEIDKAITNLALHSECPSYLAAIIPHMGKNKMPVLSEHDAKAQLKVATFEDEFLQPFAFKASTGDDKYDWYKVLSSMRKCYIQEVFPIVVERIAN